MHYLYMCQVLSWQIQTWLKTALFCFYWSKIINGIFPGGASGKRKKKKKNLSANAGDRRNAGSAPGSGRSSERGHGNSLQYSCLDNHMDNGAWWALWGHKESDMTEWLTLSLFKILNSHNIHWNFLTKLHFIV